MVRGWCVVCAPFGVTHDDYIYVHSWRVMEVIEISYFRLKVDKEHAMRLRDLYYL
jgi:hypothetical protein